MGLGLGLFFASSASAQGDAAALAPWQSPMHQASWSPGVVGRRTVATDSTPIELQGGAGVISGNEIADGTASCGDCGPCGDCECEFGGCFGCGPAPWLCDRFWVRAEYLAWWGKSAQLPALVTTSPTSVPIDRAGILGLSGTEVLFGGSTATEAHSGGRFTVGGWLPPCEDEALEATYTFLGSRSLAFQDISTNTPILARPFYNVQTAEDDAFLLSYPNVQSGAVDVSLSNELHWVDVIYRRAILRECDRQLDFLFGYRYGDFNENLAVDGTTTYLSQVGPLPVGSTAVFSDRFDAENVFHGGEIGLAMKASRCRWSLEMMMKLALGGTRSRVTIDGETVATIPGQGTKIYDGGFSALPTNMGTDVQNHFSVIPELGVTVGYDLTCRLKATFGYTFIYWSQVARPGESMDTYINTSQMFGQTRSGVVSPVYRTVLTDYWAQGLNAGLEYRF